jgi:hypothetical protein
MSEREGERCILPPPLPDPPEVRRQPAASYSLAARTAHLLAREAIRAFDRGDRERLFGAVDALVDLADQGRSTPQS